MQSRDAFQGVGGTPLDAHTPDVGGPWTQVGAGPAGSSLTGTGAMAEDGATLLTTGLYTVGPAPASADYRVSIDITRSTTNDNEILPAIRIQPGPGLEHYSCGWFGDLELYRYSGGAFHDLGDTPFTWAGGATHTLTLEAVGDRITVSVDGVVMISVIDAGISLAGFPGFATAGSEDNTGPTGTHGDNWVCDYPHALP